MHYKVSVIIPLAPKETIPAVLEEQLDTLPVDWEILICSTQRSPILKSLENRIKWVYARSTRAYCLNEGAKHALGEYLWFLHADSILINKSVDQLSKIMQKEEALYYFDLKFYKNSCPLIKLNEWGVRFRSRCLKTPFGDQGFFIKRELFERLEHYSTEASYGEDHLLIREYRRNKVSIIPIGMSLYTSARKYEKNGWLRTTLQHLYLWQKQAFDDRTNQKGEMKNENSHRNLLQDPGDFTRENAIGSPNR